jgi:isoleucyl-tRNA synthetase
MMSFPRRLKYASSLLCKPQITFIALSLFFISDPEMCLLMLLNCDNVLKLASILCTANCAHRTALAEAELDYNATHTSTAVTVRLLMQRVPVAIHSFIPIHGSSVFALIWTTTPWTLPVNQAVCFNPDLSYSLISIDGHDGELYIVASELVEMLQQKLGQKVDVITSFPGTTLRICMSHLK